MGYLLKEALKTLCGVNQWSYAVFWKIGCQNPNLLIWEECYCNPVTDPYLPHSGIENPDFAFDEWEACRGSTEGLSSQFSVQAGKKVQQLVNRMMLDNQVNILGEGLVGRAAFTGRYQWILSNNYTRESHSLEVVNELSQQVSAGMQTVAVIPVLPHGVFQFGSLEAVMENMEFVTDVRTLILQLGCVPGALFSETYAAQEYDYKIGTYSGYLESSSMAFSEKSKITDLNHLTSYCNDNCNQQGNSQISRVVGQTSNGLFGPTFQHLLSSEKSTSHGQAESIPVVESKDGLRSRLGKGAGAEIIPSNWQDQEVPLYTSGYRMNQQHSVGTLAENTCSLSFQDGRMFVNAAAGNHVGNKLNKSDNVSSQWKGDGGILSSSHKGFASGLCDIAQRKKEICNSSSGNNFNTNYSHPDSSDHKNRFMDEKYVPLHVDEGKQKLENGIINATSISYPSSAENISFSGNIPGYVDDTKKHEYAYCSVGADDSHFEDADLFDMLGLNFENKPFNECFPNKGTVTKSTSISPNKNKYVSLNIQNACSELQLDNEGNSESGIFSGSGTDHLLDAVISKVQSATKQSSDDNVSCRTTLTKLSSSSAVTTSASTGRAEASKLFGLSKSLTETEPLGSWSLKSGSCKKDLGNYSQTTSLYGSQTSSKVEKGYDMKISTSSSTAYSKRAEENNKSNRKRLKPGENPRPRPKDRQMIQDRVKELREIVPNSAKCSIDALLERTIKHMTFLQNVSKHADTLKHAGESKIIGDGGGLLLKDNSEGGATWAYEIGSQSMVCPIIVEDLNPPRQMLVQILCEKRGLFLEIADIVRGLGLTILKGVMETQNDKIWARFAVEANRDVTRMEIFVSLVGLLEQTINSTSASVNYTGNDNVMIQQPFHQAATIPLSGMPHSIR